MLDSASLSHLLDDFLTYFQQPLVLEQLAILCGSLLLAWLIKGLVKKKLAPIKTNWKYSVASINRVVFPVSALILVIVAKSAFIRLHTPSAYKIDVSLLHIAAQLLLALAAIRILIYLLRNIFTFQPWVAASEKAISLLIWFGFALHITGVMPEVIQVLNEFDFKVGKYHFSLLLLVNGLISVIVTMLLALWSGRIIETRIMRAASWDLSLRVVFAKFIRAILVILGVLIALPLVGIDLTILSVFGGALGVGLGFGLQKIASNYVSGFIILLDRSIRLGDVITVNDRYGEISRLTARYIVLKSLDGTEAIIPNETLISSIVINHSYSNRQMRITVPIQVAYDSNLSQAMPLMLDATTSQSRILREPSPTVLLKGFGGSGINLELSFWIADPENGFGLLSSDINLAIWEKFQQAGIQIPSPQREIKITDPIFVQPNKDKNQQA